VRCFEGDIVAAFVDGSQRELKMVEVFQRANETDVVARFFGSCLDASAKSAQLALFVEGPLLRWEALVRDARLPWCVRISVALSLARLLQSLEQLHLVHCDWKSDQVGITVASLTVKLVDLKSLHWFPRDAPIGSGKQCSVDADCVQQCFRWQHEDSRFEGLQSCSSRLPLTARTRWQCLIMNATWE
jgi:hypothetical protein